MKTINKTKAGFGPALAAGLVALAWSTPSAALVVQMDELSLYKNNTLLFQDNFDNGLTPAQEPGTYVVGGTIPNGAEAGGKLTLDSAWGSIGPNALGQSRQALGITGRTGTSGADPSSLGRSDLISFSAVFDIVDPVGPLNNGYGLVLRENGPQGVLNRSLSLQVQYQNSDGKSAIRLYEQNFITGMVNVLWHVPFVVPTGADQIALELSNEDTQSTAFQAFYAFGAGGVFGPGAGAGQAGEMFVTTDYLRPQIQVYSAVPASVPEPSTWALGVIALLGLGRVRRWGQVSRLR